MFGRKQSKVKTRILFVEAKNDFASQMAEARYNSAQMEIENSGYIFRASGAEGESQPQGGPTRWKSISWEMATRNGLEPSTSSVTG